MSGALVGGLLSVSGMVAVLPVFGFWMGGALLLLVFIPIALGVAVYQKGVVESLGLAAGTILGLTPGAYGYALQTGQFWAEFGFVLVMGGGIALALAPLYVVVAKRRHRSASTRPAA